MFTDRIAENLQNTNMIGSAGNLLVYINCTAIPHPPIYIIVRKGNKGNSLEGENFCVNSTIKIAEAANPQEKQIEVAI